MKKPRIVKETCIAGRVIDRTIRILSRAVEGQKRRPKSNPTLDSVQKNNDRIATLNLTRLINANFGPDDGHLVLTFAQAPSWDEAQHSRKLFMRRLKSRCKKRGTELKAIWATEPQSRIHIHMIISRVDLKDVRECWTWGRVKWIPLTEEADGNYHRLAEYIIKETAENFRDPDNQTKQRYSRTRNLVQPVIVRQPATLKDFKASSIKPIKGYQIDEDSITEYENPVTGCPTLFYTMTCIDDMPRTGKWRGKNGKIVQREPYATFEQLRQIEFGDLFEWDYL